MPLAAVVLVLASCVLHATWNLLLKQGRDKLAFTTLYLSSAVVLYLPMFLWLLPRSHMPPAGWLCVAGTGIVYFGYFVGIAAAYHEGDLSAAYPLMRGLGPVLAFVGGVLLLGERPTVSGAAGVALVIAAALALQRVGGSPARSTLSRASLTAALFVALMYGAYSLIDKVGVGVLRVSPPLYIYLTYTTSAVLVGAFAMRRQGVDAIRAEWRANGRAAVLVGASNLLAYMLVLYAMSLPHAPVSYIVPLRTVSVLLGILMGGIVLGEQRLAPRLAIGLCMMAGITLIAWKG